MMTDRYAAKSKLKFEKDCVSEFGITPIREFRIHCLEKLVYGNGSIIQLNTEFHYPWLLFAEFSFDTHYEILKSEGWSIQQIAAMNDIFYSSLRIYRSKLNTANTHPKVLAFNSWQGDGQVIKRTLWALANSDYYGLENAKDIIYRDAQNAGLLGIGKLNKNKFKVIDS